MNTWIKVARYNLMLPSYRLLLPWTLPFAFALGAVTAGRSEGHDASGYLFSFFVYFVVQGTQSIGRVLPFGLTLGVSRRSFYAGTALLGMALALVSGLVLTALQVIERATGGWGMSMRFFRVPYLLDGPWYATWLTSAVGLFALFVYGMFYGIVFSRWGLLGTAAFTAAQAVVVTAAVVVITSEHWRLWSAAGGSFAGLTALGLTGVIAALAVLLLAAGHTTIRRATV
ncbi:MAG TPA: hypothetical protein VGM10_32890 [Actinocrinis sp.]|jgi:hypothetical protein